MLYKMNKPSENMNLSEVEINRMMHEQAVEDYNNEQERKKLKESSIAREAQEQQDYYINYQKNINEAAAKKREFLANTKASLLSECLFKLYKESSVTPLTKQDKMVARNLVNKFVLENGADELVRSFATKNLLLSEFSRITTKYYNKILEACCKDDDKERFNKPQAREFEIDDQTKDDFFDELKDIDTSDASNLIKQRVSDAVSEFVDSNSEQKLEYEDIINSAKEKMAGTTNEALIEQYNYQAKAKINNMKLNRKKNVFNCMVESLAIKSFKDDKFKTKYINESALNMDNIVNDSMLIYQMLEMVNTTNMVNVDEDFMNNYIKSLA